MTDFKSMSFTQTIGVSIANPRAGVKLPPEFFETLAEHMDMSVEKLIDMLNVIHQINREVHR